MEKSKQLEVHLSEEQECLLVTIKGEIGHADISFFQEETMKILEKKKKNVLLDFSKVTYISSAGLRVLLKLGKDLSRTKTSLILFGLNEFVSSVFEISGFNKIFNVQSDKDSALQSISK